MLISLRRVIAVRRRLVPFGRVECGKASATKKTRAFAILRRIQWLVGRFKVHLIVLGVARRALHVERGRIFFTLRVLILGNRSIHDGFQQILVTTLVLLR